MGIIAWPSKLPKLLTETLLGRRRSAVLTVPGGAATDDEAAPFVCGGFVVDLHRSCASAVPPGPAALAVRRCFLKLTKTYGQSCII